MSDTDATLFLIRTPEQLKAISDPLRQQLIGAFASPTTAKQAAVQLQAPVGRLYHHIDQLLAAGLIKVTSERQRRGAVERTFQAVAVRFRVDPGVVSGEATPAQLRETYGRGALDDMLAAYTPDGPQVLHMARARIKITEEGLAKLETRLGKFLKKYADEDGVETDVLLFAAPRGAKPAQ
jgi:predicted ArsR family transcriptional regulator